MIAVIIALAIIIAFCLGLFIGLVVGSNGDATEECKTYEDITKREG